MFIVRNGDDFIRAMQGGAPPHADSVFSASAASNSSARHRPGRDQGRAHARPEDHQQRWGLLVRRQCVEDLKVSRQADPIMGPILDKALMPLTLATTAKPWSTTARSTPWPGLRRSSAT